MKTCGWFLITSGLILLWPVDIVNCYKYLNSMKGLLPILSEMELQISYAWRTHIVALKIIPFHNKYVTSVTWTPKVQCLHDWCYILTNLISVSFEQILSIECLKNMLRWIEQFRSRFTLWSYAKQDCSPCLQSNKVAYWYIILTPNKIKVWHM